MAAAKDHNFFILILFLISQFFFLLFVPVPEYIIYSYYHQLKLLITTKESLILMTFKTLQKIQQIISITIIEKTKKTNKNILSGTW